ncbi:MAG TPA: FAD:protein FMN transferase [Campylobacterales bacterium]|nr:FAD:protein FMN transferase [Campylobacterales bacterium]HIP42122.1 FAD:protein FMN transferase [Campylobacterales bacterium]
MTSPCEVHIFCDDANRSRKIAGKILEMAKGLEQKYNFYNPNSLLSQINQRKVEQLDVQTKDLLIRAKRYHTRTKGIFDITMGTLTASRKETSIAKLEDEVAELISFVGAEHFKIKKNRILFDNPHTLIDLGGFVKEFAVDLAVKILKKEKIESALINFGGDIYALGTKPNQEPFSVGIKNPLNPTEYITHVQLKNQALTTSASYERHQKIEDKIYSHIIGKEPLQNKIISATVISSLVVESGVYSTALMIQPELKTQLQRVLISDRLVVIYK